jgi:signal transduction histidine kinase
VVEFGRGEAARIWSFTDVSKMRALEAETRAQLELSLVGRFAGEVSEYMKALLAHISELTERLSTAQENNALAAQYIDSIGRYLCQGQVFANKVQSIAAKDRAVAHGSEDLNEVLRVVVEAAQLSVGERISFKLEVDESLPRVPLTMRSLSSIFGNVLSNAVEAIDGQGWIKIAAKADADHRQVRIQVDDSGPGMDEAVAQRVCEPFFTTKEDGPSGEAVSPLKGLGMWNVYHLVRSAGGKLSLSSSVGRGTKVVLDLPAA